MPDSDDNVFGLRIGFTPSLTHLAAVMEVLRDPPDPEALPLSVEEYVMGLSASVLQRLDDLDLELVPRRGKASWVWHAELNMHLPACSVMLHHEDASHPCLHLLTDAQVAEGRCEHHGG